jgi:hypothetical protein
MHDNGSVQQTAAVRLQLEGPIFEEFEDWRRLQPKIPSRSKALRLLLERGLAARPDGPRSPGRRRRSSAPLHLTTNSTQKLETVPATSPT